MAALFLVLAIVGGVVVSDLVLENTTASDITVLHHTVTGYSEGLLLALAAALGVILGLLVVVSASTTRTRRARRRRLRTAGRDLHRQVGRLKRENARMRDELVHRDQRVRHLGELTSPADHGSTTWAGSTADHRVTVPSQLAERHPDSLCEETKRAARLRSDLDLSFLSTDARARSCRPASMCAGPRQHGWSSDARRRNGFTPLFHGRDATSRSALPA
jgi:hypothetical protein